MKSIHHSTLITFLCVFALTTALAEEFRDTPYRAETPAASDVVYPTVPKLLLTNILKSLESGEVVDKNTLRKYQGNVGRTKGKLSREQADHVWALYDQYKDKLTGKPKSKRAKYASIQAESLEASQVTLFGFLFKMAPPHLMKPVKMMNDFPGPINEDVARVSRMINIQPGIKRWHSTGLYLKAGDVLKVTVDSAVVNKGISIRVGCHRDNISRRDDWFRWPQVTVSEPVEKQTTYISNPWGGLVYVEVSKDTALTRNFVVTLSGGFRAPHYVSGMTSPDDWQKMVKESPAPFAELENDRVILTFQSEALKRVKNPEAVLSYWKDVIAFEDELSAHPVPNHKERIVLDIQISAGYLHAGYPIMGPLSTSAKLLDLDTLLKEGSWGWFHELGHNHQRKAWRVPVESSVNIFSLYVMHKKQGFAIDEIPWLKKQLSKIEKVYTGELTNNGSTPDSVGVHLGMFAHLAKKFGWGFFHHVFKRYEEIGEDQWPGSQADKDALWIQITSEISKTDLSEFYEIWGYPISPTLRKKLSRFPSWKPGSYYSL